MSRSSRSPSRAGRYALPILGIALVIGVLGALAFSMAYTPKQEASVPPAAPAPVPHFIDLSKPGEPRVVVIGPADTTLPGTSNGAGILMANLRAGHLPAGATTATVLSDANCAPDADGISHCLNDLNINGVIVTIQHHHAMAEVACLSPGEKVTIMTLEQYQQNL